MKNSLVSIDAPNKAERLNAIKKLHEPCIGFDAAPISSATLKQLRIDGENRNGKLVVSLYIRGT